MPKFTVQLTQAQYDALSELDKRAFDTWLLNYWAGREQEKAFEEDQKDLREGNEYA